MYRSMLKTAEMGASGRHCNFGTKEQITAIDLQALARMPNSCLNNSCIQKHSNKIEDMSGKTGEVNSTLTRDTALFVPAIQ